MASIAYNKRQRGLSLLSPLCLSVVLCALLSVQQVEQIVQPHGHFVEGQALMKHNNKHSTQQEETT